MKELGPALPPFPFISLYGSFWALTANPHSGHFLPTLQSPVGLPVPGVLESSCVLHVRRRRHCSVTGVGCPRWPS